jgi:hypothetical protein
MAAAFGQTAFGLNAFAAEFSAALHRTVCAGLLGTAVLVIRPARRLRVLAVQGFAELAFGPVLRRGI